MLRMLGKISVVMLLLALAMPAVACEYCVREVGFVPIYNDPYRVVIVVDEDMPQAQRDELLAQARASLGPANVIVKLGSSADGEIFADAATLAGNALPAAVLYAPDGRTARLATQADSQSDAWQSNIAALTHSPTRDGIGQALVDRFGVVLLIDGTDEEANAVARELVENAIARIDDAKGSFDRPIELGPALRIITVEQRHAERWLLFGLDISEQPSALPEVAILFGQGKRLGPILQGTSLTSASLYTNLAHIGRDCECSLDRHWLYGSKIPLLWNDDLRRRAYDTLGFDPESAATRAEVGRILDRGQNSGGLGGNDPFTGNQDLGGFGLTIYDLDEPTTVAQTNPVNTNIDEAPVEQSQNTSPAALATIEKKPASFMASLGIKMVAGAVLIVLLGSAILIIRARRAH